MHVRYAKRTDSKRKWHRRCFALFQKAYATRNHAIEGVRYLLQTDSQSEYRDSVDRVEVIKLPAHSTNGSVLSAPPAYTSSSGSSSGGSTSSNVNNNVNDSDAPLNLSLKPATTSSSSPISGSQPLSQLSNLSQSLLASDRTCEYNSRGATCCSLALFRLPFWHIKYTRHAFSKRESSLKEARQRVEQ